MSIEVLELIQQCSVWFDIDCEYQVGFFGLFIKLCKIEELKVWVDCMVEVYDYLLCWIELQDICGWIDSLCFYVGVYDLCFGYLYLFKYCWGLVCVVVQLGVCFFEYSVVVVMDKGVWLVFCIEVGQVCVIQVLLVGNVYLFELVFELVLELVLCVMFVGIYIGCIEVIDFVWFQVLIFSCLVVCDINFVLDYFWLMVDQCLLYGGWVSYSIVLLCLLVVSMCEWLLLSFFQLQNVGM